jgi:hypothetical protein
MNSKVSNFHLRATLAASSFKARRRGRWLRQDHVNLKARQCRITTALRRVTGACHDRGGNGTTASK